jgi:hypothetical protein
LIPHDGTCGLSMTATGGGSAPDEEGRTERSISAHNAQRGKWLIAGAVDHAQHVDLGQSHEQLSHPDRVRLHRGPPT